MKNTLILKAIILTIIFTISNQSFISKNILDNFNEVIKDKKKIDKAFPASVYDYFINKMLENKIVYFINVLEATYLRAGSYSDELNSKMDKYIKYINDRLVEISNIAVDSIIENSKESYDHLFDVVKHATSNSVKYLVDEIERVSEDMLNNIDKEHIFGIECDDRKIRNMVIEKIGKDLSIIANPWENCRHTLDYDFPGIRFKNVSDLSIDEIYALKKCIILKELNSNLNSSKNDKLVTYNSILNYAADMRCAYISLNSPSSIDAYLKEMIGAYENFAELNGDKIDCILQKDRKLKFLQ